MGKCWNCEVDVFLREEETKCSRCKKTVRYWCINCATPFDVEKKEDKKRIKECKWCGFFLCPSCKSCDINCPKHEHKNKVISFLKPLKIPIDQYEYIDSIAQGIVSYFEYIKLGREQTNCKFGVPKTYAKNRIKSILARMKGFRVRDNFDKEAFERRQEEITSSPIGREFTIKQVRTAGTYGQEYRDVFNLCVCLGILEYEKKTYKEQEKEIEYDSWTRVEENQCPFLDTEELIIKYCSKCKEIYSRDKNYCPNCIYTQGGKKHNKGEHFKLVESLSNNPTCKNLGGFKKRGDGEDKIIREG